MKTCTQCTHTDLIEVAKDSDTITTQCSRCGHIQIWLNIAVVHTGPHVNPPEIWAPVARVDGDTLKVTGVPCDPPLGSPRHPTPGIR
jgi:Zn ribbon nucleic-acid-binding protein